MSKLYNKAFKIGVVVSLASFVILNVISFVRASHASQREDWVQLPKRMLAWGFPYSWIWDGSQAQLIPNPVFNLAIIALCSFAAGFLFRYVGESAQR